MNLIFSSFADAGDLTKERVVLKATADIPLGSYAVFVSSMAMNSEPVAGYKAAYWFPDGDVKAEDLVVVYTKGGTQSKKVLASKATAHFFYWGLSAAQWAASANNGVVVLRVAEWTFKPAVVKESL